MGYWILDREAPDTYYEILRGVDWKMLAFLHKCFFYSAEESQEMRFNRLVAKFRE